MKECINGQNHFYNSEKICEFKHEGRINIKPNIKEENMELRKKVEELIILKEELIILNENKDQHIKNLETKTKGISEYETKYLELKIEHDTYKKHYETKYNNLLETHNKCIERIDIIEKRQEMEISQIIEPEIMKSINNSSYSDSDSHDDLDGDEIGCEICEYKTTGRDIVRHIKVVHEGFRFQCDYCPYKATYNTNLKRHKETQHGPVQKGT